MVSFRSAMGVLPVIQEGCGLMPIQYSPDLGEALFSFVPDGNNFRDLAGD